ncbi:hypothetical protein Ancab_022524 [Ancistrocladus abbreviatus]
MPFHSLARGLQRTVSSQICTLSSATLFSMLNDSLQNGLLRDAGTLFDEYSTSKHIDSWNEMLKLCVKTGDFHLAHNLFIEMPEKDIVSWNIFLSGLRKNQNPEGVCHCYIELQRFGLQPTGYTFSIVISTVSGTVFAVLIPQLHAQILKMGLNSGVFVGSALMRAYTKLGDHCYHRVFAEILCKEVTSWNALLFGYMESGLTNEAQRVFSRMPEKDVVSWTIMVDGYLKNKQTESARSLFDEMSERNVVSWTAMISGYAQGSQYSNALQLFLSMLKSGTKPNQFTFSIVLDACAGCSSLLMGEQVHASIIKQGIRLDVVLSTALVDMYAKCGEIEAAYFIFESMPQKNLASWNSVIGGYARHGLATRALEEFNRMSVNSGLRPNQITFVNVLSACGHGGFVEEGEKIFTCMSTLYGVQPELEHYTCMVDLYGRAGHLDKAVTVVEGMPFKPDVVVWGALLGACGLHSNFELGEDAADALYCLQKDHPAVYSILSKILGERGAWSTVINLRSSMKEQRAKKQKASSWII